MKDAIIERVANGGMFLLLTLAMWLGVFHPAIAQELSPVFVPVHEEQLTATPVTIDAILETLPRFTSGKRGKLPARPPSVEWRAAYGQIVTEVAHVNNIPPNLIMAVIAVESGFNPRARNGTSYGLMQIKLPTARRFGLENGGVESLLDPVINIRVASNYLAAAYKLANGNACRAVSLYNRGLGSAKLSHDYCAKVARIMRTGEFQVE